MKILVMGGGIIGVSSAWYLAQAGHEVTVIDRHEDVAKETSFANAGQISAGYASPWAAPGVPLKALFWMFKPHAPLYIPIQFSLHKLAFMRDMFLNCNDKAYAHNKSAILRLTQYSLEQFSRLRKETGINYDGQQKGTIQLFRKERQLSSIIRDTAILKDYGIDFKILDAKECVQAEPGLARASHLISGGIQFPQDETGDCYLFTRNLAELCKTKGVRFAMKENITTIEKTTHGISKIHTDSNCYTADAYVMALGSFCYQFMHDLGVKIPIYPIKGYSLTVPITDFAKAPLSTVLDESYKIAITRLGSRVRIGGIAELSGYDLSLNLKRKKTLEKVMNDLYPDAVDMRQAEFWCALRAMTPNGVPIIGSYTASIPNLWLNTGHGTLGWTMSLGAGKILADIMSGKNPAIAIK